MNERRLSLDFTIALGALFISTVAAVATVYQTHVIARQFNATVWPYVSFDATNSPTLFELDLRNDGLGPAIVRSAKITWDDKAEPSLEAIFSLLARDPRTLAAIRRALRSGSTIQVTTSTPTRGLVIPANTPHVLVRMNGAVLIKEFRPQFERLNVALCYCSLTGDCWTQTLKSRNEEPKGVRSCA